MERDSSNRAEILEQLREALEQTKALRESARGALDSARERSDPGVPVEKIIVRAEQLFEELSAIFRRAIAECSSAVVLDLQCPTRDELSKQAIEVLEHLTHLTVA